MARDIEKEVIYNEAIQVTKIAVKETIDKIEESKSGEYVMINVIYQDSDGKTLQTDSYLIIGDKYTMLMSECPDFAPLKPKDEYREVDLWYIIDLIRSGL